MDSVFRPARSSSGDKLGAHDTRSYQLTMLNLLPGFETLGLTLLGSIFGGLNYDLIAITEKKSQVDNLVGLPDPNVTKKIDINRTLVKVLQGLCRDLRTQTNLANLLCENLYDRSEHLMDTLAGKPFDVAGQKRRLRYFASLDTAVRIHGTNASAIAKEITRDCKCGAGSRALGRTYFLDGVQFSPADGWWVSLDNVFPIQCESPEKEFECLKEYTKPARVSWIVGSQEGVMRLFFLVKSLSGKDTVVVIGDQHMATANQIEPLRYLEGVRVYVMNVVMDLQFDVLGQADQKSISRERWCYRPEFDSVLEEYLKKLSRERWNCEGSSLPFIEYLCECVRYPALFIMDLEHKDSAEAFAVNLMMSFTADTNEVGMAKKFKAGVDSDKAMKTFKTYARFTAWIYQLVELLSAFDDNGERADPDRFTQALDGHIDLIPFEHEYIFEVGIQLLIDMYHSIQGGSTLASTKGAIEQCLSECVEPEFMSEKGIPIKHRAVLAVSPMDKAEWNPQAAIEALMECRKHCALLEKLPPRSPGGASKLNVKPKQSYISQKAQTELKLSVFL